MSYETFNMLNKYFNKKYGHFDNRKEWDISQGVRTSTLNVILKKHNFSYYVFDILNKCFDKNIYQQAAIIRV